MSKEKLERRKRMGDDPTAKSQSNTTESGAIPPQPMPNMPQGAGNMMNNTMVGESMGYGNNLPGKLDPRNPQSNYGDDIFTQDVYERLGSVGYAQPSGQYQNQIPGTKLNLQPYNTQAQPFEDTMVRLDSIHQAEEAGRTAERLYGEGQAPSYMIGPSGMMGTPMEMAFDRPNPGMYPLNTRQQSNNQLDLRGVPDAQAAASGMDTGRGGGRNKTKGA